MIENSTDDKQNANGRTYWQKAWKGENGVQKFPLHSSVLEDAKWHYLRQDIASRQGCSLEVGCGSGHVSSRLAEAGFNAYLLDYSPVAIDCARHSFLAYGGRNRKAYLLGNALSLPVKGNTFDLVVSCGVLEHFEHPECAVAEMVRVLRPGGLFYADIWPDRFSLLRLIERLHSRPEGWFEIRMNAQAARRLITEAGLEIIRLFSAGVMPPRCIPGTGRLPLLARIEQACVGGMHHFWRSLDNTPISDLLGSYYYIAAIKSGGMTNSAKNTA